MSTVISNGNFFFMNESYLDKKLIQWGLVREKGIYTVSISQGEKYTELALRYCENENCGTMTLVKKLYNLDDYEGILNSWIKI